MRVIDGNGTSDGRDHDDPGAIVDAAAFAVEGDDFEAGQMAALAADFLTGGAGAGTIHQARVQEFLWSALPRKFPREDWFPMVDGTARLFDKLGLTRYAEIARSDATRSVLEAWATGDEEGFERFLEEHRRSGTAPPDTELIEWGELMGIDEALAFETVSVALEAAIMEGEYQPDTPGWRARAAEITRRTLDEQTRPVQPTDLRRYRRLDLALGSRVDTWATATGDARHRKLRESAASHFMDGPAAVAPAPPPPDDLEAAIAPMAWLLETCRDGVRATASGYLAPEVVRAAAERFGWWIFEGQPRTEVDVIQLLMLHEIAKRKRWVLRRSKRISTTKSALALLDDPVRLWWAIVRTVGQQDTYAAMVSELVAMRLLDGPAEYIGSVDKPSELARTVSEVLLMQGWKRGASPVTLRHIESDIHEPLREWRLFGLLDRDRLVLDVDLHTPLTVALTPTGRTAILSFLYTRATARREFNFD